MSTSLRQLVTNRRTIVVAATIALIGAASWLVADRLPRKPPNIFDTPVDGVLSYLSEEDFNHLSVDERLAFLQDVIKRFTQMNQSDSAVASAFFAGLTGPANEKLIGNARILGKDILVQGASEFLAMKSEKDRAAFLDQWIVKWFRLGDDLGGDPSGMSDQQILERLGKQGRRDLQRGVEIDARMAQQLTEFWERDVASVASPKEQAQIYQFLPAIRSHLLSQGK
jgi:hypothetical protein